ncbi:MAG TPA: ATP-binding protein [Acidobacteriaceae bacterium]|nr:ATP-binding protein [Acidobacteriaceae bacterium]
MDSQEADKLCEFLHKATHVNPHRKPGQQLVDLVQSIFDVDGVAILDLDLREIYRTGEWFDDLEEILKSISLFETTSEDRETGLIRRVLRVGQLPIGAMLLRGENTAQAADAIAAIVSITFDRYHAFASESRSESARQTEQMRTMVLDSLAHAYKTPLTAIEAAGSGLAAMGNLTSAQSELVNLIEEQANFLKQLTNRLLRTARLQASDIVLQTETIAIGPLIDDVVASLREPLARFPVAIALSSEDIAVRGDRALVTALLTQYVDNASKYAQAGTKIMIEGVEKSDAVILSVRSIGPVIPPGDHERIFDRYFRSSHSASQASGTGIGLSVAKQAAQAHGGHVWVTSTAAGVTTFYASFPCLNEDGEIR